MIGAAATGRPMRVWVTRPAEDAAGLAAALDAAGIAAVIEPLLRIDDIDGPPLDLDGVQALLATSANGVRAFARRNPERALPLMAVGDASARTARSAGFLHVESAAGDVAMLAELAGRVIDPRAGSLLHIAAGELAGDLAGALAGAGFVYRREILYRAHAARQLSPALQADLRAGRIDGVVVFSPRTARTLIRLLRETGLSPAAERLGCFCLSRAVADAARELPWRQVVVAARPTQPALVAALTADRKRMPHAVPANSLSSTGDFIGTVGQTNIFPRSWDGGMSSDTKNDRPPESPAAPVPGGSLADATPSTLADGAGERDAAPVGHPVAERPSAEPWGRNRDGDATTVAGEEMAAAPPAAPSSDTPAASARSGGAGPLIWGLLLLAVLAAGGAAYYFGYVQPGRTPLADAQPVDAEAEVTAALDDLDGRVARLRQQLENLAPRLDAVERATAVLRQSVDQLALQEQQADGETMKALDDRLGRLEGQAVAASGLAQQVRSLEATTAAARDTASKLATTVLAVGQLAQVIDDGGSFVRQLAAVRALGGDDPDIAQAAVELEPFAGNGVPTLAALRAKFPAVADGVVRAEPATAGTGWTDRIADRVASLVAIRRTGPEAIAAGGVDGILAQAETALGGGDLQGAMTALQRLDGPTAQAAQDWIALAGSRLAAERALANLQQRALARLSAAKG